MGVLCVGCCMWGVACEVLCVWGGVCKWGCCVQVRVCNRLSGYSGYSDIRKNLSVRIVI